MRSLLGCFLFSEDDVFKTIGVLSGGERNRYALARCCCIRQISFCSTSLPTTSTCAPKTYCSNALEEYTGTVVFVSHDRYFIDRLATRVFEVGGGQVEIFPGNYEDYLWRKQGGQHVAPTLADVPGHAAKSESSTPVPAAPSNGNHSSAESIPDPAKKRLNPIKRKQLEDRVRELEEEISKTETVITNLETAMQNFVSADESQRQSQELDQRKASHAALIEEWEGLAATLQSAE